MKKALIDFVIDHLKHFKSYPMEFEYKNKVYNYKQIMQILKTRKEVKKCNTCGESISPNLNYCLTCENEALMGWI